MHIKKLAKLAEPITFVHLVVAKTARPWLGQQEAQALTWSPGSRCGGSHGCFVGSPAANRNLNPSEVLAKKNEIEKDKSSACPRINTDDPSAPDPAPAPAPSPSPCCYCSWALVAAFCQIREGDEDEGDGEVRARCGPGTQSVNQNFILCW